MFLRDGGLSSKSFGFSEGFFFFFLLMKTPATRLYIFYCCLNRSNHTILLLNLKYYSVVKKLDLLISQIHGG